MVDAQPPEIINNEVQDLHTGKDNQDNRRRFGRPVTANTGAFIRKKGPFAVNGTDPDQRKMQDLRLNTRPNGTDFEFNSFDDKRNGTSKDRYISSDNLSRQKGSMYGNQRRVWPSGNLPGAPSQGAIAKKHAIRGTSGNTNARR